MELLDNEEKPVLVTKRTEQHGIHAEVAEVPIGDKVDRTADLLSPADDRATVKGKIVVRIEVNVEDSEEAVGKILRTDLGTVFPLTIFWEEILIKMLGSEGIFHKDCIDEDR